MRIGSSGRLVGPFVVVLATIGGALAFGCGLILDIDDRTRRAVDSGLVFVDAGDVFVPVPEAPPDAGACPEGKKLCAGACVSKKDPEFGCAATTCDPCSLENAATTSCDDDGACVAATCRKGFSACSKPKLGCSYDLTSAATCGDCLRNCADPKVCSAGSCEDTCPSGTTNCNGACVDVATNANHCGSCGNKCTAGANGDPVCDNKICKVDCRANFDHCLGNALTCELKPVFYKDGDGDGWGDIAGGTVRQCTGGPGLAPSAGDCHDGDPRVYPGQKGYFPTSYRALSGAMSFDYDCNGVEQDAPGTPHFGGCDEKCIGAGFGPAGSGRTGPGVNDYCGSRNRYQCVQGGIVLNPSSLVPMAAPPAEPACGTTVTNEGDPNGCH